MSDPKDVERALRDALGRLFDAVEDAFEAAGPKKARWLRIYVGRAMKTAASLLGK